MEVKKPSPGASGVVARPRRAPGPPGVLGLRASLSFVRDPLAYFRDLDARWDRIVRRRVGPFVFHTLLDPALVREALVERHDALTKRGVVDELDPLLGDGLLASEGELWRRRRAGLAPLLAPRALAALAPAINAEAEVVLARWDATRAAGRAADAYRDAMELAIAVIGRALFGRSLRDEAPRVSAAVETVARLSLRRSSALLKLPLAAPTPVNRAYRRAIAELDELVHGELAAPPTGEPCLLDGLRALRDEGGAPIERRGLRDEAMTLLLAGHETTASTLAWTLDHLARDAELSERARDEARDAVGAPGADEALGLAPLPTIDAIVSESLRLAPPAWLVMRRLTADVTIGGYALPRRSFVSVPVHALQRSPRHWPEPERFLPERFLGRSEREHPAYLPFGLGPRRCIGEAFARAEARVFLARALARFRLAPAGPPPRPLPLATLRPAEPVRLRLG